MQFISLKTKACCINTQRKPVGRKVAVNCDLVMCGSVVPKGSSLLEKKKFTCNVVVLVKHF